MKNLYRASILYGDNIVKDRYFETYEQAVSWANYQLKLAWDLNPGFMDWYEAIIIEAKGVIF